jgi:hypothetical protein
MSSLYKSKTFWFDCCRKGNFGGHFYWFTFDGTFVLNSPSRHEYRVDSLRRVVITSLWRLQGSGFGSISRVVLMLSSGKTSPEVPFFTRFHACRLPTLFSWKTCNQSKNLGGGEGKGFHYCFLKTNFLFSFFWIYHKRVIFGLNFFWKKNLHLWAHTELTRD